MADLEVPVLCYWNGYIEYGPNGVYYQGSNSKVIKVKRKTELNRLLNELYRITGLDITKQRSKVKIFGRFPVVVSSHRVTHVHLPVVDYGSLETMLEVPSNHPTIKIVELYLELKSDGSSSSKRPRTDVPVNLERIEDANVGNVVRDSGSDDAVLQLVNLSNSGVLKPCVSSLWLDDHELRVGLCFKDSDELKKAVDWCSINGQRKCVVRESEKGEFMFKCVRWKCKWSLVAAKMAKHGFFEIITYTGPHTCVLTDSEDFKSDFEAEEIERVVRVQPTLSVAELKKWWKEKMGYELETSDLQEAKEQAIIRVFGDWEQNFVDLPKLMSALSSSNGLLVDWKYDLYPNPKFGSFCGVFWTFSQSIQGFQHCRDLVVVDYKELNGEYQLKLMIASGLDAANNFFPLAFAVTKEVSVDTWRWFLAGIREKVTQRKGLCLITRFHRDILAVINEPGSHWQEPWAYHRLCLNHLCSQFCRDFPSIVLKRLVEEAGSTSQKEEFDSYMTKIKDTNQEAWKWLEKFPPHQWALVHDNGRRRYGIMEIDREALFAVCKGFQLADHVLTGSVLLLFDELRHTFEESFGRSRASLNCGDVYTRPVTNKLQEFRKCSVTYVIMPLEDNNAFQVTILSQTNEWIVQLSDGGTCTCGEFQSYKFPCLHALAVCKKLKINPLQYVDDCYTVERYYKTYTATFAFAPVPELSAWLEASGVPTLFPPPKVVAGKPKKSDTSPKPSSKRKEPSKDKEQSESASKEKPVNGKGKDETKELRFVLVR